jgi:hypothetical protein
LIPLTFFFIGGKALRNGPHACYTS